MKLLFVFKILFIELPSMWAKNIPCCESPSTFINNVFEYILFMLEIIYKVICYL